MTPHCHPWQHSWSSSKLTVVVALRDQPDVDVVQQDVSTDWHQQVACHWDCPFFAKSRLAQ